jgi:hypothetical protein
LSALVALSHSGQAQAPPEPHEPPRPDPAPPPTPTPTEPPRQPAEPPLPGIDHPPPAPIDPQAATKRDPRKQPAPGYPREQPNPRAKPPKAPGEGHPTSIRTCRAESPDAATAELRLRVCMNFRERNPRRFIDAEEAVIPSPRRSACRSVAPRRRNPRRASAILAKIFSPAMSRSRLVLRLTRERTQFRARTVRGARR